MVKPGRGHPSPPSGSISGSSSCSRSSSPSDSRSSSHSLSRSSSHSLSRSASRSRSFSSSSSPSRSVSSGSQCPPLPRSKSPTEAARRGRSRPPQSKKRSPPPGNFGEVVNMELAIDRIANLPKGYRYVEFKTRGGAEKALLYIDGAQIDGNIVKARSAHIGQLFF